MVKAFNVYLKNKLIDTVFYDHSSNVTKDEVRQSLINHDGYNSHIRVTKQRANKNRSKGE